MKSPHALDHGPGELDAPSTPASPPLRLNGVSSPVRMVLEAVDPTGARAGILHTRRGAVPTPTFMAVGTHAHVRHLSVDEVRASGAKVMLGNTYHLMLRPGVEVFRTVGGIHRFMDWDGPVLTDSGGFQIFSLPEERIIHERGAHFRSYVDNRRYILSPERSIEVQQAIGSEIMMVLDVCVDARTDLEGTRAAMARTHRWALRSLKARDAGDPGQALFAIVQGGVHPALREESVAFLTARPFDGFAIGGLAVGETKEERESITGLVAPLLPADKPRYLMGVGTPLDLLEAVRRGIDMFDCVIPGKMAQQASAYTCGGLLKLTRVRHRLEDVPLDADCDCQVCARYSRAYLHHLMRGRHHLGARLLALHNLRHYQLLMARMREAILAGSFDALHRTLRERLGRPAA